MKREPMDIDIPEQLSGLFEKKHFLDYPYVEIPQKFTDMRGSIFNIADGNIGDVAFITSATNSIRAHHFHLNDWHFSYLISGEMIYSWKPIDGSRKGESIRVKAGELVFTPSKVAHRMEFLTQSSFIAVSALSRLRENYEEDTNRLEENYSFE